MILNKDTTRFLLHNHQNAISGSGVGGLLTLGQYFVTACNTTTLKAEIYSRMILDTNRNFFLSSTNSESCNQLCCRLSAFLPKQARIRFLETKPLLTVPDKITHQIILVITTHAKGVEIVCKDSLEPVVGFVLHAAWFAIPQEAPESPQSHLDIYRNT